MFTLPSTTPITTQEQLLVYILDFLSIKSFIRQTVVLKAVLKYLPIRPKKLMNTTYELSHLVENSIESKTLLNDIKEWIDSNMHLSDQCSVWNIGITTSERLVKITGKVRSDFSCKHFKYWNTGTFRNAIGILTDLNKHSFIFKSTLNAYKGKGRYIFIYKTSCTTKNLFYHTLHH